MTADSVTAQWGSMVAAGGHGSPQRILGAPVSSGGHGTYPLVVASPVCPPMVAPSLRAAAPLRDSADQFSKPQALTSGSELIRRSRRGAAARRLGAILSRQTGGAATRGHVATSPGGSLGRAHALGAGMVRAPRECAPTAPLQCRLS